MRESLVLQHLEEIVEKLNIRICYENLRRESPLIKSGVCNLKGEYRIIIDKNLRLSEKIEVILNALKDFEIDNIYIHPYIRRLIERRKNSQS